MILKRKNNSAVDKIETYIKSFSDESLIHIENMKNLSKVLKNGWQNEFQNEFQNIMILNKGRESLMNTISSIQKIDFKEEKNHKNKYQVSSLFLYESWKYLISDPNRSERLHLVTGTITDDNTKVLSKMEIIKMESQTPAYVQANRQDSHTTIIKISETFGHLLLGMFHSHMSKGVGSTFPSSIDIKTLKRKKRIGIDCLGGIFSLDGYVRFFSLKPFEISVYGKGVKEIQNNNSEKIFKIKGNLK